MHRSELIRQTHEYLRSIGALGLAVGTLALGAAGLEIGSAEAAPQKADGLEVAQKNELGRNPQLAREYGKLKNLMEQLTYTHNPNMVPGGALEIDAKRTIGAFGTPDVTYPGAVSTVGLLRPGESSVVLNPVFVEWHGHKLVFSYNYANPKMNQYPNEPLDIVAVETLISHLNSGKPMTADEQTSTGAITGRVRIFNWNTLQKKARLTFWSMDGRALKEKPSVARWGMLGRNTSSGMVKFDGANYREPRDLRNRFGEQISASTYLKHKHARPVVFTPRFSGS